MPAINMSYPYPLYNGTGQSFVGMMVYANNITGGIFGFLLMISVFFIVFVPQKALYETRKALISSSFITTIVTILLSLINVVAPWTIPVPVVILVVSVFLVGKDME